MMLRVAIRKRMRTAQRDFHLETIFESDADVTVLFGPSGAGKTLTLLAIAGLLRPDAGSIQLGERILFDSAQRLDIAARNRRVGFVFQDYALFPHLTVAQNVAFAPNRRLFNSRETSAVAAILKSFDLESFSQSYPAHISGGQRQRVAIARATAAGPDLLLLDEPFAALDAPLRVRMRDELLRLRERLGIPMVVITHDPDDATALGGRTIHMKDGRVVPV